MRPEIEARHPTMPPAVGYATTATFRSAHPGEEGEVYAGMPGHIEAMQEIPEPRFVVIQDLDDPPWAATFGELMCATYKRFGCAGLVTNGGARDLLQIEKLGFPTFTSCISVSHGYCRLIDVHVPVHVGGLDIRPGDLIHADANGVLVIPPDIAEDVARACPLFVEAERILLDYLALPDVSVEGFAEALKRLQQESGRILKRIRGAD